jgi:hypothetical protein
MGCGEILAAINSQRDAPNDGLSASRMRKLPRKASSDAILPILIGSRCLPAAGVNLLSVLSAPCWQTSWIPKLDFQRLQDGDSERC